MCRQEEERPQELKERIDGDSDEPEWKREEPYKGIEHEGDEGQGPAEKKKQEPQKKFSHSIL